MKNKKIVEIDNETNKILKYIEENPYSRTEQICKTLGIRETSLYRMLKRYGMNLITIRNEAIKNSIQKFLKQNPNASLEDMANYFKISISILSKDMRRFEIKNPNEVNEEQEQKREILTYMRTHPTETQGQMANHFGLSRQGFIYRLNKYNISWDNRPIVREKTVSKRDLVNYMVSKSELTIGEISEHFKISEGTARKYMREYDIKLPYKRKNQEPKIGKQEIKEYIASNPEKTQSEMAKHFHVTLATMNKTIKRYGIKWENKNRLKSKILKISEAELKEFILANPHASQRQIGEHFNVSQKSIGRLIKIYGIPGKRATKEKKPKVSKAEIEQYLLKNPDASGVKLARHFNISSSTMNRYIHMYKIEIKNKN